MYFKTLNNFFHGIMFHHFHDNKKHVKGQGSITQKQFEKVISHIGRKNILDAKEFIERYKQKKLSRKNVCITFDDSLKCQFDIALPVLEKFKIKAFFFIYSSALTSKPDLLEIYRHFRHNFFDSIDSFYKEFFASLPANKRKKLDKYFTSNKKTISNSMNKFQFYSENDVKFRIVRDNYLTKSEYKSVMLKMFKKKRFKFKNIKDKIFLQKKDVIKLHKLGHEIGLHSHSHPTDLKKLNFKKQYNEYKKNNLILKKLLKIKKIKSMSHPCGSYNSNTLKILKTLNIDIGFKQIMNNKETNSSKYEICRQDHSNIIRSLER